MEHKPEKQQLEVCVRVLPKGFSYVFAVEAKHSRGTCGSLGEWSAPLFSRVVDFDCPPRHLSLEVDARFGAVLFKGKAATKSKPISDCLVFEAPAVSYADEHRELPQAAPLLAQPGGDPWPLGGAPKRFVVRSRGRTVFAERLSHGSPGKLQKGSGEDLFTACLPERRPFGDDFRSDS